MTLYIATYVASLAAFLALDAVWLSIMAPRFYKPLMGDMVLDSFALGPAMLFYGLYGIGMVALVIVPAFTSGRPLNALMMGALFGLVAYGTYDLTNQATLKGWPMTITVLDMAWGTVATGLASLAGYHALSWLSRG